MQQTEHEFWMSHALKEAETAGAKGEVPVGAIIIKNGKLIATGHNYKEAGDPTAHAEMVAIRKAAEVTGNWRLIDCALYTTLEPCLMCVGATIQSRISLVVYGAADLKFGAVESVLSGYSYEWNHKPDVLGGVQAAESADLLISFFADRRKNKDNRQTLNKSVGAQ